MKKTYKKVLAVIGAAAILLSSASFISCSDDSADEKTKNPQELKDSEKDKDQKEPEESKSGEKKDSPADESEKKEPEGKDDTKKNETESKDDAENKEPENKDASDEKTDEKEPEVKTDLDLTTTYAALPASSGENPFKCKNFKSNEGGLIFGDTTVEAIDGNDKYTSTRTYDYSYDTKTFLLYLTLKKVEEVKYEWEEVNGIYQVEEVPGTRMSWSNVKEAYALMKKFGESDIQIKMDVESVKTDFSNLRIYKYTINDDINESWGSLSVTPYFDGDLSTGFWGLSFSNEEGEIELNTCWLRFRLDRQEDAFTYYRAYPSFKDGKISGKIFSEVGTSDDSMEYSAAGTIAGTYTTEGTGTSGCKITLKFTELPAALESYKNQEIVLTQEDSYKN